MAEDLDRKKKKLLHSSFLFLSVRRQGYEGERIPDPNSKRIAQAKLGLDRNANKKKKKKKVAALEDGPSNATLLLLLIVLGRKRTLLGHK